MSRKQYDYVAACEESVNGFDREKDRARTRKVLRKIVREAVMVGCGTREWPVPQTPLHEHADRIARELIPSGGKKR